MTIPSLKYMATIFVLALLAGGCLTDDELNLNFDTYQPALLADGLTLSTPAGENMDPNELAAIYRNAYEDESLWSLRSLLVFRNGKLVAESYLKDKQDITNRHLIWSCTKQVMGILTGIAIQKGLIADLDDPLSNYFNDELTHHSDKNNITIKNLITMQSGIGFSNDGVQGQTDKLLRQIPDNSVDFILSLSMDALPGTQFHYNDGNPHLLSALIQKIVGKPTDVWADEVLFSKIEFTNYNWVRYKDGITFGGFGIETSARELSKIALLVADNGTYKGQQIVDASWIDSMTSSQVQPENADFAFGYYWWIDVDRGIHFMWGHGGQFAFIVPQKNLVVVMTSIPNTQGDHEISAQEALVLVDRIVAAAE